MALERNKIFWSWHRKYISQFSFFHCSLYQVQNVKNLDANLIKSIFITFVPVITLENSDKTIDQFQIFQNCKSYFSILAIIQILKCKLYRSKVFIMTMSRFSIYVECTNATKRKLLQLLIWDYLFPTFSKIGIKAWNKFAKCGKLKTCIKFVKHEN